MIGCCWCLWGTLGIQRQEWGDRDREDGERKTRKGSKYSLSSHFARSLSQVLICGPGIMGWSSCPIAHLEEGGVHFQVLFWGDCILFILLTSRQPRKRENTVWGICSLGRGFKFYLMGASGVPLSGVFWSRYLMKELVWLSMSNPYLQQPHLILWNVAQRGSSSSSLSFFLSEDSFTMRPQMAIPREKTKYKKQNRSVKKLNGWCNYQLAGDHLEAL